MDFARTSRATKSLARWEKIVAKSSVVLRRNCKVQKWARFDKILVFVLNTKVIIL